MIDPILQANTMALEAHRRDFEFAKDPDGKEQGPEQKGPTRTSRVLAIAHLAMYDAWNSISPVAAPYLAKLPPAPAGADAGIAALSATAHVIKTLYPRQVTTIEGDLARNVARVTAERESTNVDVSLAYGRAVGVMHLKSRESDHSGEDKTYDPVPGPGHHRPDPFAPLQGFLDPHWGSVTPFGIRKLDDPTDTKTVDILPPLNLDDPSFLNQFEEVKKTGAASSATRPASQTMVGIFWGYDGAKGIGTPPRLYNQVVRALAAQLGTTPGQNAQLFALINMGMADAGIFAWKHKYVHNVWRPVVAIRDTLPRALIRDTLPQTLSGDPSWAPLGAPQTNRKSQFQTPNFPAYPSGHAVFGTAAFLLADLFLTQEFPGKPIASMPFSFVSDEYDGISVGEDGGVRPRLERQLTLTSAIEENKRSRIYLGVHWTMDSDQGAKVGEEIARLTFAKQLRRSGESIPLTNPSFESGMTGWTTWSANGTAAAAFTETFNGAHTGTQHLTHWTKGSPFEVWTYQTKSGLASGNYKVRAWVRKGGDFHLARLQAKTSGEGAPTYTDLGTYDAWTLVETPPIAVSGGYLEFGFHSRRMPGNSVNYIHMDDVELIKL